MISEHSYDWAADQEPDMDNEPRESCQDCGEPTNGACANCAENAKPEPRYRCNGDGYDPFVDGVSAGNCTRCLGGGTEPICQICGESENVTPDICPMKGDFHGFLCDRCRPDEPGDSFYEGRF